MIVHVHESPKDCRYAMKQHNIDILGQKNFVCFNLFFLKDFDTD